MLSQRGISPSLFGIFTLSLRPTPVTLYGENPAYYSANAGHWQEIERENFDHLYPHDFAMTYKTGEARDPPEEASLQEQIK
jgi:hypothetical protein